MFVPDVESVFVRVNKTVIDVTKNVTIQSKQKVTEDRMFQAPDDARAAYTTGPHHHNYHHLKPDRTTEPNHCTLDRIGR